MVFFKAKNDSIEKGAEIAERTKRVLALINRNPNITQVMLMKELTLSRKRVEVALRILVDEKKIERRGLDRSGYWEVL